MKMKWYSLFCFIITTAIFIVTILNTDSDDVRFLADLILMGTITNLTFLAGVVDNEI